MYILGLLSFVFIMFIVLRAVQAFYKEKMFFEYSHDDNKKKSKKLAYYIGLLVLLLVSFIFANYFFLIKLNLRYLGIYLYLLAFVILGVNIVDKVFGWDLTKKRIYMVISLVSFLGFAILFFGFGGRTYFHAEQYSNLIQLSEEDFLTDIKTVDVSTLPIVDKAYGEKLGSLKLGEYPGIGSEFEAGEYSDIIYDGQQYLVAPLEYRGIFKWINNNNVGTPGYILINKITSKTELVNLREDTGEGLIYTPSAYLDQDLTRHVYYNGMSKYQLESTYFEIDESGIPYYVLSYSLPQIFINGGDDIVKVAVVNALDGEVDIYDPNDVPSWVESVYPSRIVFNQIDYWGSLQDGWLNSMFAQKGVLQTSNGSRVIMNEGELFYFTGLTSAGNDESTIGFVYTSTKTKEAKLFSFPGATEEAAMNKALTLLPQNNITTSFPIPINVENTPTYFILIKGEDGRILRNVFIGVQDLESYTINDTKNAAYDSYLLNLGSTASSVDTITGEVTDILSYVQQGNTMYWFEIDGSYYLINVSKFTDDQLRMFIEYGIGDTVTFQILDYRVIGFE